MSASDTREPPPPAGVVVRQRAAGVAIVTITSQPLGVLSQAVQVEFLTALRSLEEDPRVRALIITGSDRAFSAGADIREFRRDERWLSEAARADAELCSRLEESRLPVVAACNGVALGGGLVVALSCDIRIAARSARFGVPEVTVGAIASGGGTQRLPRIVGAGRALDLLLTGRVVDADEALSIGLVDRVVDDELLMPTTEALAAQIARQPAAAIAATKRCVRVGLRQGWDAGSDLEVRMAVAVGMTDDATEGQAAFLEKREPTFTHGAAWTAGDPSSPRTEGRD